MWYWLPAELLAVDDRLANWGAWARPRQRAFGCRSAEGRYRRAAGEDDARRRPAPIVDPVDASRVDAALAPLNFPRRSSMLLKAHYVWGLGDRSIRMHMAIHVDEWEPTVRMALYSARNALARRDRT